MTDITIICIVHDDETTLARALRSLRLQSVGYHLVTVNDGSPGPTKAIIQREHPERLTYLEHASCQGRGAARAYALEQVQTPWVGFLDADDWLLPDKLECQLAWAKTHPHYGLISSDLFVASPKGKLQGTLRFHQTNGKLPRSQVPFAPSIIRTKHAQAVGFDPTYRVGEDRKFLNQLLERTNAYIINKPLYTYEISPHRSLSDEFALRAAHIRHDLENHRSKIHTLATMSREMSAGLYHQVIQRLPNEYSPLHRHLEKTTTKEQKTYHETFMQCTNQHIKTLHQ